MDVLKKACFLSVVRTSVVRRSISTTCPCLGKRNFRKFEYPNRRGTACDKKWLSQHPELVDRANIIRKLVAKEERGVPDDFGVLPMSLEESVANVTATGRGQRPYFVYEERKRIVIPEMVPELIVPDLTGFQLKPYVSYRAPDIVQEKFTAQDLFYSVYAEKIKKDFDSGKLDEEGNPLEPSEEERMDAEEAKLKAQQAGSDLFG